MSFADLTTHAISIPTCNEPAHTTFFAEQEQNATACHRMTIVTEHVTRKPHALGLENDQRAFSLVFGARMSKFPKGN